jgi:hypothetical protein
MEEKTVSKMDINCLTTVCNGTPIRMEKMFIKKNLFLAV